MSISIDISQLYNLCSLTVQVGVPAILLAIGSPRRGGRIATPLIVFACVTAWWLLSALTLGTFGLEVINLSYLHQLLYFSSVLLAVFLIVLATFKISPLSALFDATVGYTIQNLSSSIDNLLIVLLSSEGWGTAAQPWRSLQRLAVIVPVYLICYYSFIKKVRYHRLTTVRDKNQLFVFAAVVILVIGFGIVVGGAEKNGLSEGDNASFRVIHSLICVFVLFAEYEMLFKRQLEEEEATTEQLARERGRQYEISRESLDALNMKLHDIRHQIRHAGNSANGSIPQEFLSDVASSISLFDSRIQTGNDALDTILTEKSLVCQGKNIELSCVADGSLLGFMSNSDLYSLFGNALDNAIDAVDDLSSRDGRTIMMSVRKVRGMILINVENDYRGSRRLEGGLPITTKSDKTRHGFGVKSMQYIAEKYGGSLATTLKQKDETTGTFSLNIMLPVPSPNEPASQPL